MEVMHRYKCRKEYNEKYYIGVVLVLSEKLAISVSLVPVILCDNISSLCFIMLTCLVCGRVSVNICKWKRKIAVIFSIFLPDCS